MSAYPVLTVTANPAVDQTVEVPGFAAGKVNRVLRSRMDAGGKGINVATILSGLGATATVTGLLGSANAEIFEQHFVMHRIADRFLRVPGATRTGIKIVNTETQETTDINFPGLEIIPEQADLLLRTVEDLSEAGAWHALSGSLPRGIAPDFYRRLIEVIRNKGGHVVLDSSGESLREAMTAEPEIIKPNLAELEELLHEPVRTVADAQSAALQLLTGNTRMVVVSMGSEGAVFVMRETTLVAHPPRVEVASTVGAGDAMVAGIVWAQQQHASIEQTARIATACGAHAVSHVGASVDLAAIEALRSRVEIHALTSVVSEGV